MFLLHWGDDPFPPQDNLDSWWLGSYSIHNTIRDCWHNGALHFTGGTGLSSLVCVCLYLTHQWPMCTFNQSLCLQDIDFFQHLEMHMHSELPSLVGRDHLSFRSYYVPVKVSRGWHKYSNSYEIFC